MSGVRNYMKHLDLDNAMNIKPTRTGANQGSSQANQVPGGSRSSSSSSGSTARASGDTVTLTHTAAEMLKLEENLAKIPDIDSLLVDSIKTSIDQGTYQIDPEKIADRLLAIEKDLF